VTSIKIRGIVLKSFNIYIQRILKLAACNFDYITQTEVSAYAETGSLSIQMSSAADRKIWNTVYVLYIQ
jgi:hypothetical protein